MFYPNFCFRHGARSYEQFYLRFICESDEVTEVDDNWGVGELKKCYLGS